MKNTKVTVLCIALAAVSTLSGCGGAANSANAGNSNAGNSANKANTSSPAGNSSANANSAPVAKQGTPPKADMTMTVEDLLKDYKTMYAKDPNSIYTKYENKNIQITGEVSRVYPVTTGTGIDTMISLKGPSSTEDAAGCSVMPQTEESMAVKVGDKVTLIGTQTHNTNGSTPLLEKCFVLKDDK